MQMQIKPIKAEEDYKEALKRVEPLFDKEDLTDEELNFFDVMVTLIEAYENEHNPIDPPDPIEAIKFRMEQEGLVVKDLG